MQLGAPVTLPGIANEVVIYEVGPRDGLQNEDRMVGVEVKAEFIERLIKSGLEVIEPTSMVHPKWVPQLADAEGLLDRLDMGSNVRLPVLVPNERGLERALAHEVKEIAVFVSASEAFAQRNQNRSVSETMAMITPVVTKSVGMGLSVRAYISMCFGDPWEGVVDPDAVVSVGMRLMELGCTQLSLGDTIGVGTPGQVESMVHAFARSGIATNHLAVHFHDTYGQALANVLAALGAGVTTFDASAGGLGGCPYARNATGNLATEDLVWMLHGLGIQTSIDLIKLVETSLWMESKLGRPSASRVVRALSSDLSQEGSTGIE